MPRSLLSARAFACAVVMALCANASPALAQQDALVIDRNSVSVATDLAVAGTLSAAVLSGMGAVPVGAILMWSGDPTKLPPGWVLCDGSLRPDGTAVPDLSGRFIVGYQAGNAEYAVGGKGGEAQHRLTVEEMPNHSHTATVGNAGMHQHAIGGSDGGWAYNNMVRRGDAKQREGTVRTEPAGEHTHAVTIEPTGGGQPHENRPPFYALAYIIYVGK